MLHVSYTHKYICNIRTYVTHEIHFSHNTDVAQTRMNFQNKTKKKCREKTEIFNRKYTRNRGKYHFCKKNLKIEKNVENSGQMEECFICFLFEHCTFEFNAIWFSGVQFLNRGKIQIIRFKCFFFDRFH